MRDEQRVILAQALAGVKNNLPMISELNEIQAKERWQQYCAYVKAGFSEDQAMQLLINSVRG